jgi:hypothetical protein
MAAKQGSRDKGPYWIQVCAGGERPLLPLPPLWRGRCQGT